MRGQRFEEVLRNCREGSPLELNSEELAEGWHYCPEFEGQLTLQRMAGGRLWCGCGQPKEGGDAAISIDEMKMFAHMLRRCEKFERVDGVATLTVSHEMMCDINDGIRGANLCRIGDMDVSGQRQLRMYGVNIQSDGS